MRHRTRLRLCGVIASSLLISMATVAHAADADVPPAIVLVDSGASAAIADNAEGHSDGSWGDQCKIFANKVIKAATGLTLRGYQQGYRDAGATEVSAEAAVRGDIIQVTPGGSVDSTATSMWRAGLGRLHTAIILRNRGDGSFDVIDSNWVGYERVGHHNAFNPTTWAPRDTVRIWHFGAGTENQLVSYAGVTYRLAGGAPIPAAADPAHTRALSDQEWAALPAQPADGTFIRGVAAGDPDTGAIYRVVGGAPVYVSDLAAVGVPPETIFDVDLNAIRTAGQPGTHLLARPADGTLLAAGDLTYEVTSGAPIPVTTTRLGWLVDPAAIAHAGEGGAWSHLAAPPATAPATTTQQTEAANPAASTSPSPATSPTTSSDPTTSSEGNTEEPSRSESSDATAPAANATDDASRSAPESAASGTIEPGDVTELRAGVCGTAGCTGTVPGGPSIGSLKVSLAG